MALSEFAGPSSHGIDDDLGLIQIADRENSSLGHLPVKEFKGSQCQLRIVGGNIDQSHIRIGGADPPCDRIRSSYGIVGAGKHRTGYAGAVHQYLQHCALLIVSGRDNDG